MPAAAVIPAPIAYIKVVAVKTFVVELVLHTGSTAKILVCTLPYVMRAYYRWSSNIYLYTILIVINIYNSYLKTCFNALYRVLLWAGTITLNKLECLKQAFNA